MQDHTTYRLSKCFSPPIVDLRQARILDDYGSEKNANHNFVHRDPTDVSRRDLEAYFDAWIFVQTQDLVFYLSAVCKFGQATADPPVFAERWLETVDAQLPGIQILLEGHQQREFADAIAATWSASVLDRFLSITEFLS